MDEKPPFMMFPKFLPLRPMQHAMKGFEGAGIWPVNRNIFTDVDFLASDNLCRPIEDSAYVEF